MLAVYKYKYLSIVVLPMNGKVGFWCIANFDISDTDTRIDDHLSEYGIEMDWTGPEKAAQNNSTQINHNLFLQIYNCSSSHKITSFAVSVLFLCYTLSMSFLPQTLNPNQPCHSTKYILCMYVIIYY